MRFIIGCATLCSLLAAAVIAGGYLLAGGPLAELPAFALSLLGLATPLGAAVAMVVVEQMAIGAAILPATGAAVVAAAFALACASIGVGALALTSRLTREAEVDLYAKKKESH